MAITYSTLAERIYRQLGDPDQETHSAEIIYDAVCAAHEAILTWVPNYKDVILTAGSDGDLLQLPSDVYDVQAVQLMDESSLKFISRATLAAGTARGNTSAENDWIESPKGYLSLAYDIDEGDRLHIHYLANWEAPESNRDDDFVLKIPTYTYQGVIYYALSVILSPQAMDTAVLGPFKQKIDSGTPIHNPHKDMANWFRGLFLQEMKMMPPYQKARS
jgi:hypothetical protein